jgi:hypothetical protein
VNRRLPILLASTLLAGCAPVVTHGPNVLPGTSVTGNIGVPNRWCQSGDACGTGIVPEWTVGVRRGWVPNASQVAVRPAYQVGVSLPIFSGLPEVDAYVQAPRRPRWAYGAGGLAALSHLEPYGEVGQEWENGFGWFAAGGYAWLFRDPRRWQSDKPEMVRPPRYWAPAAGAHLRRRTSDVTVYVSGAWGSFVDNELRTSQARLDTVAVPRRVRMLVIGLSTQTRIPKLTWPHFPYPTPGRP